MVPLRSVAMTACCTASSRSGKRRRRSSADVEGTGRPKEAAISPWLDRSDMIRILEPGESRVNALRRMGPFPLVPRPDPLRLYDWCGRAPRGSLLFVEIHHPFLTSTGQAQVFRRPGADARSHRRAAVLGPLVGSAPESASGLSADGHAFRVPQWFRTGRRVGGALHARHRLFLDRTSVPLVASELRANSV